MENKNVLVEIEEKEYKEALECIAKIRKMVEENRIPKAYTEADKQFIDTVVDICLNGRISGVDVRTRWASDGTRARYISRHGVTNRYNLEKEFPILTIRNCKAPFKKSIDEIDWIYFKQSNNVNDLGSKIWDQWADKNGYIGKAYGYQINKPIRVKTKDGKYVWMNQLEQICYQIANDKESRRIITEMYNMEEIVDMNLAPCAHGTQWLIKDGYLDLILTQRSQDMLTANGWNVMQYAAMQTYLAKAFNLKPGELIHNIGDCHIYLRHLPQIVKLFEANDCKNIHAKLKILTDIKNPLTDFKVDDFILEDYEASKVKIGRIEVAE